MSKVWMIYPFWAAFFGATLSPGAAALVPTLECQIYDLATAQVLASGTLNLYSDTSSGLTLESVGVVASVQDHPLEEDLRQQRLKIDNGVGHKEAVEFNYRLSDLGNSEKFPYVTSEFPGAGDTLIFYCR